MIKREENMFRVLFDSVTEGIVVVNEKGLIELTNPVIMKCLAMRRWI